MLKKFKLFLAIIFTVSIATAWELRTIHGQGLDHTTSLVITVTSDNYSNINTFWDGANQLRDYLIAAAPFNTFSNRIIINALGRTGNNFGSNLGDGHMVQGTNINTVRSTINTHTQNRTNVFLLLNNSTNYGGVAHNQTNGPNSGLLAVANHPGQGNWRGLMLHEMGHVWGDLRDEYDGPWCPQNTAANQSTDGNSNTNKWRHWVGIDGVGIFPLTGAWGQGCGLVSGQSWFRPHQDCRMRDNLSQPFCRVCQASITRVSANVMGQPFWGGNQNGTSVTIPAGRTDIMFAEFNAMPNLTSITIPASVTRIGDFAFLGCPNLRTINISATTPPTVNNTTFHGLNRANITVNVPAGTAQAYINAGWTGFRNLDAGGGEPVVQRQVSVSHSAGGVVRNGTQNVASGTNISVNNGSNLTLTFVPNSGHKISQVIINGMNNTAAVSAGQHTFTNITSNQSINVNFVADVPTFTIQFLSGTSVNIPNQSAAQGSSITLPTPTRDGFTFTGWHTSNATGGVRVGGGGESYSPLAAHAGAGNVIQLSARWQENEIPIVLHTATFNSNGGSNVPTITGIPANTTINTPVAPTRSGHTFTGWYREAALTTPWNFASDVVSSDITLFAKWESISITITFDGLGGTQPNPMNFTGSPVILPNSERDGFRFVGWFTAETGGVRAGSAGEQFTPEDETQATLFARWEEENTSTFVDLLDGSHSWIGLTDDFKTGSEASLTAGADKITFNIKVGKIEGENYTWAQIMSFPGGDWSGLEEIEIKYSSQQDIVLTLIDNQGWSGAGRGFQIVLPSGNNRTQNIKWSDFGRINESASWSEFPAGSGNWIQDHKDVTPVTPSQLQHFIGVSIKPLGIEASGEISTLKLFGVIYDEESDTPTSITRPQPERSNNRYGIKFAQNPVSDNAEISVVLPNNERIAEMNVIIYDMTGNVVFDRRGRIYSTLTDDGAIVWDLRNRAGRFVSNGAYLVVVEARDRNGNIYRYSARLGVRR